MKIKVIILFSAFLFSVIPFSGVYTASGEVQQGVTITVLASDQQIPIIEQRVAAFVAANSEVAGVTLVDSGSRADDQFDFLVTTLSSGSDEFDIISMDVIFPAGFAVNGWLEDLSDIWPQAERDKYIDAHIEAGIYNGNPVASPFFMDSGLVLYRKDILERNGLTIADFETWADFKTNLNKILDNATEAALNPSLEGYVFQGDAYEGGIVNLVEWMGASGGTFLNEAGTAGNFATSAEPALTWWNSLIAGRYTSALNNPDTDAVSERSELIGDEGSAVTKWWAGNAVFQRNWPFSFAGSTTNVLLNGSTQLTFVNGSVQADPWFTGHPNEFRFGVTSLPYNETICGVGNTGGCRSAVLGGSVLGIPTSSTNKAAAKLLLQEIASEEAQLEMFRNQGNFPAINSAYTTAHLGDTPQEFALDFFANVFPSVLPRPVHQDYQELSAAIQPLVHNALSGVSSVDEALEDMDTRVNLILGEAQPTPGFEIATVIGSLGIIAIIYTRKKKKD